MSKVRFALVLVFLLPAAVAVSAEPVEMISNGGFEEGLAGWNPDAKYELVEKGNVARAGKNCLTGERDR